MTETKEQKKYEIVIGWMYPDLMSIYGDRGNIICLVKRCEARGINVTVKNISLESDSALLKTCDLFFMGGAQDSQQTIVSLDLKEGKSAVLAGMIEDGTPGLYICGAYQLLGKYYKEADGTIIEGLGILDIYTENPGQNSKRLIGNVAAKMDEKYGHDTVVGFENHGGRTHLGKNMQPLGTVLGGFGNNGEDKTEGVIYKNSIGSYFHGPILPKNPSLADFLIKEALEKKYGSPISLKEINDTLARKAHDNMLERI